LNPAFSARRANAEDRQDRVIASPTGKHAAGASAYLLSLPSEGGKDALAAFSLELSMEKDLILVIISAIVPLIGL
jgi:hypothetical protein